MATGRQKYAGENVRKPSALSWPNNLFEAMAPVYAEKTWSDWAAPHRPIRGGRGWLYPTLLLPERRRVRNPALESCTLHLESS